MDRLYRCEVINKDGIHGRSYVVDGLDVTVSSPLNTRPGTNPEELLGLSFSTCLSATLKQILKEEKIVNRKSKARVYVDLYHETDERGYYFLVTALLSVESFKADEILEIVKKVERRCPVSKLLIGSDGVSVLSEDWT